MKKIFVFVFVLTAVFTAFACNHIIQRGGSAEDPVIVITGGETETGTGGETKEVFELGDGASFGKGKDYFVGVTPTGQDYNLVELYNGDESACVSDQIIILDGSGNEIPYCRSEMIRQRSLSNQISKKVTAL